MFIAALLAIAKRERQPKGPSVDDWIKMWYPYTMEYYKDVRKNEISPFATTRMDLEAIMLSEMSQTEKKDKYHVIWLICGIQKAKPRRNKARKVS